MIPTTFLAIIILLVNVCTAFTAPWPTAVSVNLKTSQRATNSHLQAYVPDGLSKKQYEKIKKAEANKNKGKNLGALGARSFKSRSLEAWQKAHEKGQASHVFAPVGYRDKMKKGLMKKVEVPYMVRGGSWDNSDLPGTRRLPWNKKDVDYAHGGDKKAQSASLLGAGPGLDWTGTRQQSDIKRKNFPGFS